MSSSEEEFKEPEDQHSDEERVIIFSIKNKNIF